MNNTQLIREPETLQITIGDDGLVVMIDTPASRVIAEHLGITHLSRASHVEPDNGLLRVAFHFIRERVTDDSRLAAWTRSWRCLWRITLSDSLGGHTLPERFRDREQAIAHEVNWLNRRFAE